MNKEDIKHLSNLARIEVSDSDADAFSKEISAIVSYVEVIQDIISGEGENNEPKVGVRFNVFRKDVVSNEPDSYTKDILAEMPKTEGRFMVVKKILQTDGE